VTRRRRTAPLVLHALDELVDDLHEPLCGAGHCAGRRKRVKVGRLYSIATDPTAQGRGVGRLLLQACEAAAVQRECHDVSLEVRVSNLAAITFYERHGYRIVEELTGFYEDGTDALRMRKHLL
jgi:ribosomal protein S18 acetylase RimI-like enzyme